MSKIQDNLAEMKTSLSLWSNKPLFERKDGKKDTLLNLEDKKDRANKRYEDIKETVARIRELLDENKQLFGIDEKHDNEWRNYIAYIDGLIERAIFKTIACR